MARHVRHLWESLRPLRLHRAVGQVHLERDGERALLVEFSDAQGRTYALVDWRADQLMVLHRRTEAA